MSAPQAQPEGGVVRRALARLHGALSRVTATGAYIPEVDGLRFVAIMAVVAFHAHKHFFPEPARPFWEEGGDVAGFAVRTGYFGVQLFFVISGFVLALPFAEWRLSGGRAVGLKAYFLRRLTRLEPPYVVSLVVIALAQAARLDDAAGHLAAMAPHFFAHLFYVHSLVYGDINAPGFVSINNVTWSLEVEIQFYLLAPWLASVFLVRERWRRRALIAAGIVAGFCFVHYLPTKHLNRTVLYYLHYFAMGFLLVDVYLVDWRGRVTKTAWWDLPGVLAWASIPFVIGLGRAAQPLLPVVVFVAYLAAFRGKYLAGFFRSRFVTAVGGMCYTIYLYHSQMIWWVKRWFEEHVFGDVVKGDTGPALLKLAVVGLAIVAISAVMYVLFEKPFMRRDWHRRWFSGRAPSRPDAAVDVAAG